MQTFLPYPDFATSAKVLDWRRLGKQRLEARQIIETLNNISNGWLNHPAVKMWRSYESALALYLKAVIDEWVSRGYLNEAQTVIFDNGRIIATLGIHTVILGRVDEVVMPPWVGNAAFHASHRSNLLRKDYAWYSKLGWKETPDLPYVWPQSSLTIGQAMAEA